VLAPLHHEGHVVGDDLVLVEHHAPEHEGSEKENEKKTGNREGAQVPEEPGVLEEGDEKKKAEESEPVEEHIESKGGNENEGGKVYTHQHRESFGTGRGKESFEGGCAHWEGVRGNSI